uniref:3-oxoacyl-[acyl-carrier-protein] reductase n=1 Tax=Caenorhabditis tropicalis TaxID=1561998 RepID=A0A1I7V0D6_9PELO
MVGRFSGKVAIITGSSFGIGRETALLFAKEGAKVTVTGRNEERLQGTRQALLDSGIPETNFLIVPADITTSSGQDTLISKTLERFGKLDILVNNAGASIPDSQKRTGINQGIETYEQVMRLNVQSVIEMTQKVRPHLAKSKGDIVNVSSIVALNFGWARTPYYPLAKAALDQYTRSAAIDLIHEGIRVNTVNPGVVQTGFHESATGLSSDASQKFYDDMGSNPSAIPCGFSGRPEHIAKAIAFLAHRDSSEYIIGQNIIADGGTSLVLGLHAQFPRQTKN